MRRQENSPFKLVSGLLLLMEELQLINRFYFVVLLFVYAVIYDHFCSFNLSFWCMFYTEKVPALYDCLMITGFVGLT